MVVEPVAGGWFMNRTNKGGNIVSDKHAGLRTIPLPAVLAWLGIKDQWKIRKQGTEYYGPCPFPSHNPRQNTTSFSFTGSIYHCFSCGAKGSGAIDMVMAYQSVNFTAACEFLAKRVAEGAPMQKDALASNSEATNLSLENRPFAGVYEKSYVQSEWLQKRGLTEETLKFYGVGQYHNPSRKSAYDGKIMIPIRRFKDGEKVGYLARDVSENPESKYIFPKGFQKHLELYGSFELKKLYQLPVKVVFLVESPFCVMKFRQLGFAAASPFGWSVSEQQQSTLQELTRGCIFLPDRNKRDHARAIVGNLSERIWIRYPPLPEGIDDPERLDESQIRTFL